MKLVRVYDESCTNAIVIFAYICDICNYNCSYCYNHQPRTNKILDLDSLKCFIESLNSIFGKQIQLSFIGGEPTLHPKLLDFCKNSSTNITIYSNFSADIKLYNQLLENNVTLALSWHSENNNFIDKFKQLNKLNNVDVTVMAEPKNFIQALNIFENIKNNFEVKVDLCQIFSNSKEQMYTSDQFKLLENYLNISNTEKNIICQFNNNTTIRLSQTELIQREFNQFKYWKCNAGQDCFFVNVNGEVFPCQNSNTILGNIYTNNICPKRTLCKAEKCFCELGIYKERVFK